MSFMEGGERFPLQMTRFLHGMPSSTFVEDGTHGIDSPFRKIRH